jgi:hypothetical protein
MKEWSIRDSMFSHAFSTSNWFKPTHFKWNFKDIQGNFVFLTDRNLHDAGDISGVKKYAWLIESPHITPDSYNFVNNNPNLFDKIFTHSKKILQHSNAHLVPVGGCHLDENEIALYNNKTKLISMMYSDKKYTPGHILRHKIAASECANYVDIMGSGKSGHHVKKIESCKDYKFSVVVENCKEDFYFTEKIIDCFLSGTIPIYWGCPSIGNFFNTKGFYQFDSLDELFDIVSASQALHNFYENNKHIIEENYNKALLYKIGEDYLYNNYQELIEK